MIRDQEVATSSPACLHPASWLLDTGMLLQKTTTTNETTHTVHDGACHQQQLGKLLGSLCVNSASILISRLKCVSRPNCRVVLSSVYWEDF